MQRGVICEASLGIAGGVIVALSILLFGLMALDVENRPNPLANDLLLVLVFLGVVAAFPFGLWCAKTVHAGKTKLVLAVVLPILIVGIISACIQIYRNSIMGH
jgi:hypothetical protein